MISEKLIALLTGVTRSKLDDDVFKDITIFGQQVRKEQGSSLWIPIAVAAFVFTAVAYPTVGDNKLPTVLSGAAVILSAMFRAYLCSYKVKPPNNNSTIVYNETLLYSSGLILAFCVAMAFPFICGYATDNITSEYEITVCVYLVGVTISNYPAKRTLVTYLFIIIGTAILFCLYKHLFISALAFTIYAGILIYYRERLYSYLQQWTISKHENLKLNKTLSAAINDKERFVRAATHDLSQPLLALTVMTDMMNSRSSSDDLKMSHISDLKDVVTQLGRHVTDLGDQSGSLISEARVINIYDLASTALKTERSGLSNPDVRYRISGDVSASAYTYETNVDRIISNLINNANKFTSEGHVTVTVLDSPDTDEVIVKITDTGTGISDHDKDYIFDDDYQATGTKYGNGLGLATVRRFCKQIDATIEVSTSVGEGSTFTVTIPKRLEDALANGSEFKTHQSAVSHADPSIKGAVVLILEDDPMIGKHISSYFEARGATVLLSDDPDSSLDILATDNVHYALIDDDLGSDSLTGFDVAVKSNLPTESVTIMTGNSDQARLATIGEMYSVYRKPFEVDKLRLIVQNIANVTPE